MATIKKSDIYDGNTAKAEHITRIIDSLDGTTATDISITGATTIKGLTTTGGQSIVSGSGELNIEAGNNSVVDLTNAGRVSGPGFVLPLFEPVNPVLGSAYFDGASELFIYDGSQWISVVLAP
jgi:hypothetical protein